MPGAFAHRAATVLSLVLAVFAGCLAATGFRVIVWLGELDSAAAGREILPMTVAHLVAALLGVVTALLLGRRARAARALAAVLAAAFLALNVYGFDSLFASLLSAKIHSAGWGGGVIVGDQPGQRLCVIGAVLAAFLLVTVLIAAITGRNREHRFRAPAAQTGFGAPVPGAGANPAAFVGRPGQVHPANSAPPPHIGRGHGPVS